MIMQLARPVETQADVEILFRQKLAPFIVDGGAVGLDAVDDLFVGRQILFLQIDGFPEEFDAEQGRLAAVP
jgi:hypothetical protein